MAPVARRRRRTRFSATSHRRSSAGAARDASREPPPPSFYGITHTLHRVSPIYVAGDRALDEKRLNLLGRRLRELLVGDVVRGVVIGTEAGSGGVSDDREAGRGALANAGQLLSVDWSWVAVGDVVGFRERYGRGSDGMRALRLVLRWEHLVASAVLLPELRDPDGADEGKIVPQKWRTAPRLADEDADELGMDDDGRTASAGDFLRLPLLLVHMPAALRGVVVEFISSVFDCRVSDMRLGTATLVRAWEAWVAGVGASAGYKRRSSGVQEGSVGPGREEGVIVTLGFSVDEPDRPADLKKRASGSGRTAYGDGSDAAGTKLGLKAVDVAVPLLDIQRFVDAGRLQHDSGGSPLLSSSWTGDARTRRRLAGGRAEEGWGWLHADAASHRTAGNVDHPAPFIAALARYLSHHLALDLFHPSVRITKIASAGFTLAEGGRVRIAEPPTPVGEGRHADGGLVEGGTHHQAVWDLLAGLSTRATGRLVA